MILPPRSPSLPKHHYVRIGPHLVHYTEWGAPSSNEPTVVCWHGLARTGRDFDFLAEVLSRDYGRHVVCPDIVGRGLTTWAVDPDAEYNIPAYVVFAEKFLAALRITRCDWVGSSMGAMMGYMAAGGSLKGVIRRLMLNDTGPYIEEACLTRLARVASPKVFADFAELEKNQLPVYLKFGVTDEQQRRHLLQCCTRRTERGGFTTHFDPRVVQMLSKGNGMGVEGIDNWAVYDRVECPTLVIHSSLSDFLSESTVEKMKARGPRAVVKVVEGIGHVPMTNTMEQINIIANFFLCKRNASKL